MKRSALYVVLLLILVLVIAVLCIRIFTTPPTPTPDPTQEPTKDELTLPPVVTEPEAEFTPPAETEAPTPEPIPDETEMPFETREPLESEDPEPDPEPELIPINASGSIRSATGTGLNLVADWVATDADEGKAALRITVSAESYSFFTSALYQSLELVVNGETYRANTPEVAYDGSELVLSPLAEFALELPRGTADLSIVWHYKGSYSGVEIADISIGALLNLS